MKTAVILQRFIPHYRLKHYNGLADYLKYHQIKLIVIHSSEDIPNDKVYFYLEPLIRKNLKFLGEILVFSPGLYSVLKKLEPFLILSEDISNLPNGLIVTWFCRNNPSVYGISGLGKILNKKSSFLKKLFSKFIKFYRTNASFFIGYSHEGAGFYSKNFNKKSVSYNNSVINAQKVNFGEVFQKYEKMDEFNLIFIGRIEKYKKLDLLIEVLNDLHQLKLNLFVIGEGSEKKELEKIKVHPNVKIFWLGKINDKKEKDKIFWRMHLGVMPGSGGLVIQELQAYAIPVIASYSDGTEIDLIKKINPELFIKDMSQPALSRVIEAFIKRDSNEKTKMARNAYEIVKNKYNLDNMIKITAEQMIRFTENQISFS